MFDWLFVKDAFAVIGIFYVTTRLVFGTATLIDEIKLRGF